MELKPPCERIGNREKILRCAVDLFYHVGYQATSIEDILKQSGVHKSNFLLSLRLERGTRCRRA